MKTIRIWWSVAVHLLWMRIVRRPALLWLCRRFAWVVGKRNPKLGSCEDTAGAVMDPGVEIEFGGACPVQGWGTVDGLPCYYRSRGDGWQFELRKEAWDYQMERLEFEEVVFEYSERCYLWPDGGWVHREVSEKCIRKAVARFRAEQKRRGVAE
jgi:hypothetical protein